MDGEVVEALPNTMFLVRMDNGMDVLTTICGKMRRNRIRVTLGDRPATVVSLDNEHIVVDTNHPLAGETLTVDLQLVAIVA